MVVPVLHDIRTVAPALRVGIRMVLFRGDGDAHGSVRDNAHDSRYFHNSRVKLIK